MRLEVGDRVGFAREEGGESRESEEGGYGGGDTWWQSRGGRSELGAGHGGEKGDEDRVVVGVGRRGRDRSRIGLVLTCLRRNVTSRSILSHIFANEHILQAIPMFRKPGAWTCSQVNECALRQDAGNNSMRAYTPVAPWLLR